GLLLGHSPLITVVVGVFRSIASELLYGTVRFARDTDDDGVYDDQDDFPTDAAMTTLSSVPGDSAAPVITLVTPENAVLQ
ncbi:MAG: hypothetical protein ACFBZ8_02350, partial [Opitutales bacterium]